MTDETTATATTPDAETSESQGFDLEKSDNLSQIRDYAKGLKSDLETYKQSHLFVDESFGSIENAKIAQLLYSSFAGEEFNVDDFNKILSQLSPQRAEQLAKSIAGTVSEKAVEEKLSSLFGGKVSEEEVKLFRQWKETGYNLGDDDDIPEALKFDKDGNPRSDEEIEFLRGLQRTVQETRKANQTKEETERQQAEQTRQAEIQKNINEFSSERIKVLDNEFNAVGLMPSNTDTAELAKEKEFVRNFLINGISGMFLSNPDYSNDYDSAMRHISNGERLLARRYEPRIEKNLLTIFRSEPVKKLLQAFTVKEGEPQVRPEISTTGTTETKKPDGRVTADDIFNSLVASGKVKV